MKITSHMIDEKAQSLFDEHERNGTLKTRPATAVMAGLSGGPSRTATRRVIWQDYRPEARAWFSRSKSNG